MVPINESETRRKSLSTRESQALSRLASEGRRVVTIGDVEDTLESSRKSATDMAYSLKEKGWLERLPQGKYLIPLLDPTREATGTRDSKYQLRLNVEPETFLPDDFT